MDYEREIAGLMWQHGIAQFVPESPVRFSSNIVSPMYCDNRLFMSLPRERELIIQGFLVALKDYSFTALAGTATAGIPWCSWIADRLGKPMIYARREPKKHGKESSTEGILQLGEKYVVIEDLISTGKSSLKAVQQVRESGGLVENCIAVFSYEFDEAVSNFSLLRCNLKSLTNLTKLIEAGVEGKYLKPEDRSILLKWKKDPYSSYQR